MIVEHRIQYSLRRSNKRPISADHLELWQMPIVSTICSSSSTWFQEFFDSRFHTPIDPTALFREITPRVPGLSGRRPVAWFMRGAPRLYGFLTFQLSGWFPQTDRTDRDVGIRQEEKAPGTNGSKSLIRESAGLCAAVIGRSER